MSYQPLATKYRPERFEDLVGQEAVAKALAGAIRLNRLHHSIIFSGVRGIGKTTTARLLAKALNCENGPTPEPCGVCDSCRAITLGHHEDVLEIDGASNNGVDEVRILKETVSYFSRRSKYKVYIIDEVHMLSVSAFNALLKTLEEPPPDVVFIFATTELHKVPATVVGRCLTFTLKKMTIETITQRIERILLAEGIPFEPRALQVIAREGNGSMRDALTFLDQVIAIGNGEVKVENLTGLVSSLSSAPILDLLEAMLARNGGRCIEIVDYLDQNGAVFAAILDDAARFSRHLFILRDLGRNFLGISQLGLTDDEISRLTAMAQSASALDSNRIFRALVQCRSELDGSDLDRFIFENNLLEWCLDPGLPEINDLLRDEPMTRPSVSDLSGSHSRPQPQPQSSPAPQVRPRSLLNRDFLQEIRKEVTTAAEKIADLRKDIDVVVTEAPVRSETVNAIQNAAPDQKSSGRGFPASWRELVDIWKQMKPLQARKLEEVHPVEYSPQRIVVAVDPGGMIGPTLLQLSTQKTIEKMFRELFSFSGEFSAIAKDGSVTATSPELSAPSSVANSPTLASDALPASILQDRAKEKAERRAALVTYAKEHQLTQEILSEFNGKIVDVRVSDPALGEFA